MALADAGIHFWWRLVEMIFAIIAFAPIAEGSGYSRVDFAIFCGVTTMIFALVLMACYLANIQAARGQFALVYDVIWWIFWLSCAAALSNSLAEWGGWMGSSKGRLECSVAFSWLTWFLFWGDIYFDYQAMRGGSGSVTMPPQAAPGVQMGAPPTGAYSV